MSARSSILPFFFVDKKKNQIFITAGDTWIPWVIWRSLRLGSSAFLVSVCSDTFYVRFYEHMVAWSSRIFAVHGIYRNQQWIHPRPLQHTITKTVVCRPCYCYNGLLHRWIPHCTSPSPKFECTSCALPPDCLRMSSLFSQAAFSNIRCSQEIPSE